jgi:hypothetical protein
MLWKQPYSTIIFRDVPCPVATITSLTGSVVTHERQVWIGGFGFDAIGDQGVWWRLFQSDFAGDQQIRKVFIWDCLSDEIIESAFAIVPRSEANQCLLVEDPSRFWQKLIQPKLSSRGFAAIIEDAKISLLMVGPPTEEAWEEFSSLWSAKS